MKDLQQIGVYQQGFYDGAEHAQSQIHELTEQNRELMNILKECLDWEYMSLYNECLYDRIEELITKHKQTERRIKWETD